MAPERLAPSCVAALILLAGCAAQVPRGPVAPRPGPGVAAGATASGATAPAVLLRPPAGPPLELAPDPALQRLIDPYPAPSGPSWLGADVATSIPLGEDHWVWLFGDTLLGTVLTACPPGETTCGRTMDTANPWASLVRNSVGVLWRGADGVLTPVVKYWRVAQGAPAPIFAAERPGEFLWPMAGHRAGRVLLVTASRHTDDSGLFPVGNSLVRVTNPEAPPDLWSYTLHDVPNVRAGVAEADPLTWTAAMVEEGGFLYLFGQRGVGFTARTVLCRMPSTGIDAPGWEPEPEYLLEDPGGSDLVWSQGFSGASLHELEGLPGTSEASVEHFPGLGWTTFQIPPLGFDVRLYTAPSLVGPWTDRGVVYRVPPPWSVVPRLHCATPELACGQEHYAAYAVKSHPELAPPGGFAVSYNVNLLFGSLEAAEREAEAVQGFYVPQMTAGVVAAATRSPASGFPRR